ncbi:MAG: DUF1015 family protein [Synergistaceae bacterium]|nr:DUF1015 family protein [Synergistaceae bacterium]
MATIRPFRGVRPKEEYAVSVAALPYDVLNSEEAGAMAAGNPHSFLHVDKSEIDLAPDIDLYDDRVYEKAAENLRKMIADGILRRDESPMFYIYAVTMDGRTQTGVVVCAAVDEYLDGTIRKHELTREDKEKDRVRHVETCNAQTGPIFMTYRAQSGVNESINSWTQGHSPVYDFVSEDGVGHQVWLLSDPGAMADLQALFRQVPRLYIADGHHRNAAAAKVALKRRENVRNDGQDAEYNYYLAVLFPHDQLYIMDYNRVVKDLNGMSQAEWMKKVEEKFLVTPSPDGKPPAVHSFGMYLDGKWHLLRVKDSLIPNDPLEALDVSILQNMLLEPVLGIEDPRTSKRIDFVGGMRGLKELEKRVDSGEMAVAFALYPTSLEELFAVVDAGKIMPPKSTWFEPKLRSGLFIHLLD